jgi:hypothetical protein
MKSMRVTLLTPRNCNWEPCHGADLNSSDMAALATKVTIKAENCVAANPSEKSCKLIPTFGMSVPHISLSNLKTKARKSLKWRRMEKMNI